MEPPQKKRRRNRGLLKKAPKARRPVVRAGAIRPVVPPVQSVPPVSLVPPVPPVPPPVLAPAVPRKPRRREEDILDDGAKFDANDEDYCPPVSARALARARREATQAGSSGVKVEAVTHGADGAGGANVTVGGDDGSSTRASSINSADRSANHSKEGTRSTNHSDDHSVKQVITEEVVTEEAITEEVSAEEVITEEPFTTGKINVSVADGSMNDGASSSDDANVITLGGSDDGSDGRDGSSSESDGRDGSSSESDGRDGSSNESDGEEAESSEEPSSAHTSDSEDTAVEAESTDKKQQQQPQQKQRGEQQKRRQQRRAERLRRLWLQSRPSAPANMKNKQNDDICSVCGDGGDIMCCDYCVRSWHEECIQLAHPDALEDEHFYCADVNRVCTTRTDARCSDSQKVPGEDDDDTKHQYRLAIALSRECLLHRGPADDEHNETPLRYGRVLETLWHSEALKNALYVNPTVTAPPEKAHRKTENAAKNSPERRKIVVFGGRLATDDELSSGGMHSQWYLRRLQTMAKRLEKRADEEEAEENAPFVPKTEGLSQIVVPKGHGLGEHKQMGPPPPWQWVDQHHNTYFGADSMDATRIAAAGAADCVDFVWRGLAQSAFAVVRPPGHHCCVSEVARIENERAGARTEASGFCLVNNVAVAVQQLREMHEENLQRRIRVAIVDFDVHAGDGTEGLFWDDPDTLLYSQHRYDSHFYPYPAGAPEHLGPLDHAAFGSTVNVPLARGDGNAQARTTMREIGLPILRRFRPDIVLISAGYDGMSGDIGELELTKEFYAWTVRALRRFVCKRVVTVLEGGYVPENLAKGVMATTEALLDDGVVDSIDSEYGDTERQVVRRLVAQSTDRRDKKPRHSREADFYFPLATRSPLRALVDDDDEWAVEERDDLALLSNAFVHDLSLIKRIFIQAFPYLVPRATIAEILQSLGEKSNKRNSLPLPSALAPHAEVNDDVFVEPGIVPWSPRSDGRRSARRKQHVPAFVELRAATRQGGPPRLAVASTGAPAEQIESSSDEDDVDQKDIAPQDGAAATAAAEASRDNVGVGSGIDIGSDYDGADVDDSEEDDDLDRTGEEDEGHISHSEEDEDSTRPMLGVDSDDDF
ncbi:MAG: hypothetical protein MHM6MM_000241 [Cercozoa sp. M6MM]